MPIPIIIHTLMFSLGVAVWVWGYRKMAKQPARDRSRGLVCVPGLLITVLAVILFAFYWHWIVGGIVVAALAYTAYKKLV